MAHNISNSSIDMIYETAINNGALEEKYQVGGGGFMFFYCPRTSRFQVVKALSELHIGHVCPFEFSKYGLKTWTVKN